VDTNRNCRDRVNLVPLQYIVKECVDATDADTAQSLHSLSEELPDVMLSYVTKIASWMTARLHH